MDRNTMKEQTNNTEPTMEELLQEITNVNARLLIENTAMKIKIGKMSQLLSQYEELVETSNKPVS